ncbi:MAG: trypsin-like peptidase domain-containing protein [Saprospiraceae bacterium]|nr:trypsin-like peptidase domain-containing protein [Saprospiraceae bacterium]
MKLTAKINRGIMITLLINEISRRENVKILAKADILSAMASKDLEKLSFGDLLLLLVDNMFELFKLLKIEEKKKKEKNISRMWKESFSEMLKQENVLWSWLKDALGEIREYRIEDNANIKQLKNKNGEEIAPKMDDRVELWRIEKCLEPFFDTSKLAGLELIKKNHNSVVLIVHKDELYECQSTDDFILVADQLKDWGIVGYERKFHYLSPYGNQKAVIGLGTGFLVRKEDKIKVITAAHLFHKNDSIFSSGHGIIEWDDVRIITGFTQDSLFDSTNECKTDDGKDIKGVRIKRCNIYEVINTDIDTPLKRYSSITDWAIFSIKGLCQNQPKYFIDYSEIDGSPTLIDKQPVYGIGHGMAQPLKLHLDGKISYPDFDVQRFKCCLDMFPGNSGSPIFDAQNHKVIGMLVSGIGMFKDGDCFLKPNFVPYQPGLGEVCQKLSEVVNKF